MTASNIAFCITEKQAEVLRELAASGPQQMPAGFAKQRTWRSLIAAGLVVLQPRGGGWWLSAKGQAAASLIEPSEAAGASVRESVPGVCDLCGKPMPAGEEMFKFHGYSGPCPTP